MRTKTTKNQNRGSGYQGYRPSRATENTKHISCISGDEIPRLKVLVNSGSFDDLRDPSKPANEQQDVQQLLSAWVEDNEDCRVYRQPKSRGALKHDTKAYKIAVPPPNFAIETIPSGEKACLVLDKDDVVLAYKFRIPTDVHQKLVESNLFLSQAKRANYSLWAKSTKEICMSSDYRKHLPHSANFFEHNEDLFRVLDDVLRLLDPVMYKKYTNVDQFLKDDEKRLAGAWHGAIINRQTGSKEEAVPHKNWKDWGKGLTAMIPWGDYEGGDVVLYNLGLRFELKPCDVLLFNARVVSYGVQEVTQGVRDELDLVVQGTTIKWRHEKVTNGGTKRAEERKKMERERKKREKERAAGSMPIGIVGPRARDNIRPAPATLAVPTSSNSIPLGTRVTDEEQGQAQRVNVWPPTPTNNKLMPRTVNNSKVEQLDAAQEPVALKTARAHIKAHALPSGTKLVPIKVYDEGATGWHKAIFENDKRQPMNAAEAAAMAAVSIVGKSALQIRRDRYEALTTHRSVARNEKKAALQVANNTIPHEPGKQDADKKNGQGYAAGNWREEMLNSCATPPMSTEEARAWEQLIIASDRTQPRNSAEEAVMAAVNTEGKMLSEISKARRKALNIHRNLQAKKDSESRKAAKAAKAEINANANEAQIAEPGVETSDDARNAPKSTRLQKHAAKMEQQRLDKAKKLAGSMIKKQNKKHRKAARKKEALHAHHQKKLSLGQIVEQNMQKEQQAGVILREGIKQEKKRRMEDEPVGGSAVAKRIKSEHAPPKKEVTRENIGGRMVEVMCLD